MLPDNLSLRQLVVFAARTGKRDVDKESPGNIKRFNRPGLQRWALKGSRHKYMMDRELPNVSMSCIFSHSYFFSQYLDLPFHLPGSVSACQKPSTSNVLSTPVMNEEPTYRGIWLSSAEDALIIANLCIRGELEIIRQRPVLRGRHRSALSVSPMLQSGNVVVWEDDIKGLSHSMRWIDKIPWTPSRKCLDGPFYYYVQRRGPSARVSGSRNARRLAGQPPLNNDWRDERPWELHHYGSLINSQNLEPHGLIKKTWSIVIPGDCPRTLRIISYYKAQDVTSGAIRRPTETVESSLFQTPWHESIQRFARALTVESKQGHYPSETSSNCFPSSPTSSPSPQEKVK